MITKKVQEYIELQLKEVKVMLDRPNKLRVSDVDELRFKKLGIEALEWFVQRLNGNVDVAPESIPENSKASEIQRKINQAWEEINDSKKYYECANECDIGSGDYDLYMNFARQEHVHAKTLRDAALKQLDEIGESQNNSNMVSVLTDGILSLNEMIMRSETMLYS